MNFIVTSIIWLVLLHCAIALQLTAIFFSRIIALFVDTETGNLPVYLRWFQTPDATCYDEMWVAEHPTWSKYKIAYTWIARNPAYGFRKSLGLDASKIKNAKVSGDINIADGEFGKAGFFFVRDDRGFWNFSYVIDLHNGSCMRGEMGWYLLPKVKGYESINTGMLQTEPIRFYSFGRKGN